MQARALATKEARKPKQASLRRAVSAAYYSLFHLLTEDAAKAMFPSADAQELRAVVRRAFEHATMKEVAQGIASTNPAKIWQAFFAKPSPELILVARTFVDLQRARYQADYDFSRPFDRDQVIDLVDRTDAANKAWKSIRKNPRSKAYGIEALTFLAALMVHRQVSRN